MATHTYKWMMSPQGASLLVLRPELRERMRPLAAGWFGRERRRFKGPPGMAPPTAAIAPAATT